MIMHLCAKLNAIIMALEFIVVNEFMIVNFENIIIYSDSLSSLELPCDFVHKN